jgi:hypothetical protein
MRSSIRVKRQEVDIQEDIEFALIQMKAGNAEQD